MQNKIHYYFCVNEIGFEAKQHMLKLWNYYSIQFAIVVASYLYTQLITQVMPRNLTDDQQIITKYLSFGPWQLNALLFSHGMYLYNVVLYRYTTLVDYFVIVVEITIQYCGSTVVPLILASLVPCTFPNSRHLTCERTYLNNSAAKSMVTEFIIVIFLITCVECKKRANLNLNITYVFIALLTWAQLSDMIEVGNTAFGSGSSYEIDEYHDSVQLVSASMLSGVVIASILFQYNYDKNKIGQKLKIAPESTWLGQYIANLSVNRFRSDFLIAAVSVMGVTIAFASTIKAANPFLLVLQTVFYRANYAFCQACVVLLLMFSSSSSTGRLGATSQFVPLAAVLVAKLNKTVMVGLEFGPPSTMIEVLLLVSVMAEVYAVTALIQVGFGRIVIGIQKWINVIGKNLTQRLM